MPEQRITARRRRSLGFPILTLLIVAATVLVMVFIVAEVAPDIRAAL